MRLHGTSTPSALWGFYGRGAIQIEIDIDIVIEL